jgi:hypothetical protein
MAMFGGLNKILSVLTKIKEFLYLGKNVGVGLQGLTRDVSPLKVRRRFGGTYRLNPQVEV